MCVCVCIYNIQTCFLTLCDRSFLEKYLLSTNVSRTSFPAQMTLDLVPSLALAVDCEEMCSVGRL